MNISECKCEVCPRKIKWISCKEKMPRKDGYYLVSYNFGGTKTFVHELYYKVDDDKWYIDEDLEELYAEPTVFAWATMPESYEVEDDEV